MMCSQREHRNPTDEYQALRIDNKLGLNTKGTGCHTSSGTGYKGRQGLYEVMALTSPLSREILKGASTEELRDLAVKEGMLTLRMDGMVKVKKGVTTLEEVVKETAAG